MWIWLQKLGELRHGDVFCATGYSGYGAGKNNPLAQHIPNAGPIPQGAYHLGSIDESDNHGPLAIHLIPILGTELFGRSGFLIHGDSKEHPGAASHGCIILPRPIRERLAAATKDRLLVVLSGLEVVHASV